MIGGPDIRGRLGRKKCAQARQRVRREKRLARRRSSKPSAHRPSSIPGSERITAPKLGVYYSDAPAVGWSQDSANRTPWPFNTDGSRK